MRSRKKQEEYSGVEDNVPSRCITKSRAETAAITAAHNTVVAIILSSYPLVRAGALSIQLIDSMCALRALSVVLVDFQRPIFCGKSKLRSWWGLQPSGRAHNH